MLMLFNLSKKLSFIFIFVIGTSFLAGQTVAQTTKKPKRTTDRQLEQESDKKENTTSTQTTNTNKPKKVMITDFDARGIVKWWGGSWDIGSLFANSMIGPLSRTNGYEVVERQRMQELFAEQGLSQDERFNQSAVTKIGRLLGADYILFGFLTDFTRKKSDKIVYKETSARISFSARFVDVATGKVVNSVEINYESPKKRDVLKNEAELNPNDPEFLQSLFGQAIAESVKNAVAQLTGESVGQTNTQTNNNSGNTNNLAATNKPVDVVNLKGKVADVTGTSITINRGRNSGVKEGQIFVILKILKEIKDPDTGQVISQKTEELARLKITKVDDAASEGVLISGDASLLSVGTEVTRVEVKKQ